MCLVPNGDARKEYGPHQYPETLRGTPDCGHKCGCCVGPTMSDGPVGLDPLPGGICPRNPIDGQLLGGQRDYANVVRARIDDLNSRAYNAECLLEQVEPGTIELARQLEEARNEIVTLKAALRGIGNLIRPFCPQG